MCQHRKSALNLISVCDNNKISLKSYIKHIQNEQFWSQKNVMTQMLLFILYGSYLN